MKNVYIIFLFIFIVISIFSNCSALFKFGRRKCAPYRTVSLLNYFELLGAIKNRQNPQESLVVPILPRAKLKLSTLEEIKSKGYNASTHIILSKDGYYTTVDRISGGILSPPRKGKQAVLLFHGLGGIGSNWIIQPGSRNLAFLLADAGYEVWLANGRGSSRSMKHTHLNANRDISYWSFSFEEMGTEDLPLIADLILQKTGTNQIYYVCHSLGCGLFLAGLSEKPELNKKFKASFLLAPGAYFGSGYGPVANLGLLVAGTPLEDILNRIFMGRFRAQPEYIQSPAVLYAIFGVDSYQLNQTNFRNALEKGFDNSVARSFFHGGQNIKSCSFRRYDHGRRGNLKKYGKTEPQTYNLDGMTVPTYIFYGESDNLLTPWDVKRTRDAIPSKYMRGFYRVEWSQFNHLDFITANDADVLVYNRILNIMTKLDLENTH
ncbi:unnamed protein product [Orchesella dallaii]|uniref:Lipase n=1 Tax=Orchesella dallaii TaxID=48710 RepID=A0ABP1R8X8_9HEXA